jgi:hypothetical protein
MAGHIFIAGHRPNFSEAGQLEVAGTGPLAILNETLAAPTRRISQ